MKESCDIGSIIDMLKLTNENENENFTEDEDLSMILADALQFYGMIGSFETIFTINDNQNFNVGGLSFNLTLENIYDAAVIVASNCIENFTNNHFRLLEKAALDFKDRKRLPELDILCSHVLSMIEEKSIKGKLSLCTRMQLVHCSRRHLAGP